MCRNWANKWHKYYSFCCFTVRSQTLEEGTMSSMTLLFGTFSVELHLQMTICFPTALQPNAGQGILILDEVSRSHTTTHHSLEDYSGRVISPSQRPLPDNTQHSQQTDKHPCPGGIRTHNLSKRPQTYALDRAATGTG